MRIGNWKRNITLPVGLAKLEIDGAKYVDNRLNILFQSDLANESTTNATTPTLALDALRKRAWQNLMNRKSGK